MNASNDNRTRRAGTAAYAFGGCLVIACLGSAGGCGALGKQPRAAYFGATVEDAHLDGIPGIVVTSVDEEGPFVDAGIAEDHIIVSLNGEPATIEALANATSLGLEVYAPDNDIWFETHVQVDTNGMDTNGPSVRLDQLGGTFQELTPGLAELLDFTAPGARIVKVYQGSPAQKAGLVAGDILVAFLAGNSEITIEGHRHFAALVQQHAPGVVDIRYVRGENPPAMATVVLEPFALEEDAPNIGIAVLEQDGRVIVDDVSDAARNAGLHMDDVVTYVGLTPVSTVVDFWGEVALQKEALVLGIEREGRFGWVELPMPAEDDASIDIAELYRWALEQQTSQREWRAGNQAEEPAETVEPSDSTDPETTNAGAQP